MSKAEDGPRGSILRFLDAAAVGAAVAATAYLCAFYLMGSQPNYRGGEIHARFKLGRMEEAIKGHREATGRLPATLAELGVMADPDFIDVEGRVLDPWRHPYQYRVDGDAFTLYSFGPDGLPGGEGIDADVYPKSTGRVLQRPTLRQFTYSLGTEGVQWTCFAAGVCAALACLLPPRNRRAVGFLSRVIPTAIGAVLIAVVISLLHLPTGH
jgi:general secretion pathway protein G